MKLSPRQYAEAYLDACDGANAEEQKRILERLLVRLRRAKAGKLLPRILAAAEELALQRSGTTRVRITTARPHSAQSIANGLKEQIGAVVVDHTVDPSLKGGAVLTVGDTRIDGSVTAALRRLRVQLSSSLSPSIHSRTKATV